MARAEVIPAPKKARSPLLYIFIGVGVVLLLLIMAIAVIAVIVYRKKSANSASGYTQFGDMSETKKDLYTHSLTNPTMERAFLPQYNAL